MHADHEYLAAGYVLGGLSDDEYALAQSLYDTHAEFRAEVASFEDTMAAVAQSDDPLTPSPELEAAILDIPHRCAPADNAEAPGQDSEGSVAAASADDPAPAHAPTGEAQPARRTRRGRLSATMFALAASMLVVAIALGSLLVSQTREAQDMEESLTASEEQRQQLEHLLGSPDLAAAHAESALGGSVTVTFSQNEQMVHVMPHNLPDLTDEEAMQMWLIGEDGPQSIGLMSPDAPVMLSGVELDEGLVFGVTVEPAGGSPEPTTDPVIAAEL